MKSLTSMTKIDKKTENSMLAFLENQLSELGIEIEVERAKNKNITLEKIQLKNSNEMLTKVKIIIFYKKKLLNFEEN